MSTTHPGQDLPLVTEPEILTSNAWREDHHYAAVLDRFAELIGPANLGRLIWPRLTFPGNPRKVSARSAGAVRRLSTALDHYGAELCQDLTGPAARRLIGAIDGTGPITAADLAERDGEWPGSTAGEYLSELGNTLEDIGAALAGPGLAFGPIPDDGSWAFYWAPSDDDIFGDGETYTYGPDDSPIGTLRDVAEWCARENYYPMVWRVDDHGGGIEPVSAEDLAAAYVPRWDGREVTTADLREVAGEWHGGQWSALYAFTSSGAIRPDLAGELRDSVGEGTEVDDLGLTLAADLVDLAFAEPAGLDLTPVGRDDRGQDGRAFPDSPTAVNAEYGGDKWYAVWAETSYSPAVYLIGADNDEGALDVYLEMFAERDGLKVEDLALADYPDGDGLTYGPGGEGPFDIEAVDLRPVAVFPREREVCDVCDGDGVAIGRECYGCRGRGYTYL